MIPRSRRLRTTLGLTVVAVAVALIPAAPVLGSDVRESPFADLERTPFEIQRVHAPNHTVSSAACRNIRVTARHNARSTINVMTVYFDLWRGSRYLGETVLEGQGDPRRVSGTFQYCPEHGVGTFTVKDPQISYYDADRWTFDAFITDSDARTTFTVRQSSRIATLSSRRQGNTVTLRTTARYYSVNQLAWRNVTRARLPASVRDDRVFILERRAFNGGGNWRAVQRKAMPRSGATVTFTQRTSTRYQYRVRLAANPHTVGAVSGTVRR